MSPRVVHNDVDTLTMVSQHSLHFGQGRNGLAVRLITSSVPAATSIFMVSTRLYEHEKHIQCKVLAGPKTASLAKRLLLSYSRTIIIHNRCSRDFSMPSKVFCLQAQHTTKESPLPFESRHPVHVPGQVQTMPLSRPSPCLASSV